MPERMAESHIGSEVFFFGERPAVEVHTINFRNQINDVVEQFRAS